MATKEEKALFYLIIIGFAVTGFTVATFYGSSGITGYITYPTYDEMGAQVKSFVENFGLLAHASDGASMCIRLFLNEEEGVVYTYDVQKQDGEFIVHESDDSIYCNGITEEDFIITFPSYQQFRELKDNPTCENFMTGGAGEYFYYLPSKFIKIGGNPSCNEEFQEIYCPALYYCAKRENFALNNMDCCLAENMNEEQIGRADVAAGQKIPRGGFPTNLMGNAYFWVVLVLIVSAISLVILIVKEEHKKQEIPKFPKAGKGPVVDIGKRVDKEYLSQMRDYIRQCVMEGYTKTAIENELKSVGWPPEIIENELENVLNRIRKNLLKTALRGWRVSLVEFHCVQLHGIFFSFRNPPNCVLQRKTLYKTYLELIIWK